MVERPQRLIFSPATSRTPIRSRRIPDLIARVIGSNGGVIDITYETSMQMARRI